MRRRVVVALSASLVFAACTGGLPDAEDRDSIETVVGPDEVLFQYGSYNIAENIDQFVSGPELVVYGDGSAYGEESFVGPDSDAEPRRAQLDDHDVRDLIAAARELPDEVSQGEGCATDALLLTLIVERRSWSSCNLLEIREFRTFIGAVRAEFDSASPTLWTPESWVQFDPVTSTCAVATEPTVRRYHDAPIYPHREIDFPLGPLPCPWG